MNENIDVNSADAIFIPSNIEGDKTDYTEYKVGWHRSVPANCALVRMNRFTGKLSLVSGVDHQGNVIGGGFKLMPPFISKSIFVPIIDRTIDYPKASYLTYDNIYANVDIVLKVRITDPVKYLMYGKFQLSNLNTLTQNLLRAYVKIKKFDELSVGRISLDDFTVIKTREADRNGNDIFKIVDSGAYKDFEEKYGISVQSIQLKDIKLPDDLQKLYDDKKEEEMKKDAQKIRLEAEKEKAEAEARMMDIRTEAEVRRARQMAGAPIQGLKDNGISAQAIEKNVGMFGAKNSVFIGGNGNDTVKDVAAGVVAGNAAMGTNNEQNESNSQRLIDLIEFSINSGMVAEDKISTCRDIALLLKDSSRNQSFIATIDKLSEGVFDEICKKVINGEFSVPDNSKSRHK